MSELTNVNLPKIKLAIGITGRIVFLENITNEFDNFKDKLFEIEKRVVIAGKDPGVYIGTFTEMEGVGLIITGYEKIKEV